MSRRAHRLVRVPDEWDPEREARRLYRENLRLREALLRVATELERLAAEFPRLGARLVGRAQRIRAWLHRR